MPLLLVSYQIRTLVPYPIQSSPTFRTTKSTKLVSSNQVSRKPIHFLPLTAKSQQTHHSTSQSKTQDEGISAEDVKVLVKFKSRYNYIRVLQVSRKADHPFAGSRLLLLDEPGNIHSISFLFKSFTDTYFDVFATLPPILPPGPIGILGFGAGSAARLILELYPQVVIHGWELDPSVIAVGREYFGLSKLEKQYQDRLFVYVGNALMASVKGGKEDSSVALTGALPDLDALTKALPGSLMGYVDRYWIFCALKFLRFLDTKLQFEQILNWYVGLGHFQTGPLFKMSSFPVKLLAVIAICVLVGVSSAPLPFGSGEKESSLHVSNCRDGSRKMTTEKEVVEMGEFKWSDEI
ncbi:hypothetical protein FNV43_RR20257 [Rhamnella rubrinervis]|uniref:Spermidine synthase n=1 Tax=Rhamnella rubrinervis TaxID=2594499 RepID=A0A8K0GUF1_9ROSA|nr:hypothetical protein FNV43_RR20257 [Rhamnella rubrinervis]